MGFYDFTVKDYRGNDVPLKQYAGKVVLVVNTATECGFTPQYEELQELYATYQDKGLVILDFPCNQFGEQAPGTNAEIHGFCTGRFGVTFPQMDKVEVNGDGCCPLYAYLQGEKGFQGFDLNHPIGPILQDMMEKADPDFAAKPTIKWNFTKFLINRNGEVVARFEPTAGKAVLAEAIRKLL